MGHAPNMEALAQELRGMAEAVRLLQARADKMPTPDIVMAAVEKLAAVMDERTTSSKQQFTERDKAIDAVAANLKEQLTEVRMRIDDVKERFLTSDSRNVGRELGVNDLRREGRDSRQDSQWIWGVVVGVIIAATSIIASFLMK